jgi:hypothetical protein
MVMNDQLQTSLARAEVMRALAANSEIQFTGFETTAWTIVSNAGLLVQLDEETFGPGATISK